MIWIEFWWTLPIIDYYDKWQQKYRRRPTNFECKFIHGILNDFNRFRFVTVSWLYVSQFWIGISSFVCLIFVWIVRLVDRLTTPYKRIRRVNLSDNFVTTFIWTRIRWRQNTHTKYLRLQVRNKYWNIEIVKLFIISYVLFFFFSSLLILLYFFPLQQRTSWIRNI